MVYCGKPSRACHACRERKSRCDAKPEGCTQCYKAKRTCPGYRAQVDLIFRDQSANVIRKAKARHEKVLKAARPEQLKRDAYPTPEAPASESADTPKSQPEVGLELYSNATPSMYSLFPAIEDRATLFFASNYAIGLTIPGYGEFNSVTVSYVSDIMDTTLLTTMKATSLASYANHVHSKEISDASQLEYSKALRLTNSALSSSSDATKDSTLLSVILLSLYEMLTGRTEHSMKNWAEHVRGLTALLKLRGTAQLHYPVGRRIFVQAVSSIITNCLQRSSTVPSHVVEMIEDLDNVVRGPDTPEYVYRGVRILRANLAFSEFNSQIRNGVLTNPTEIISIGLQLDESFTAIHDSLPFEWRYEIYSREDLDPTIAYNGYYHVYWDVWAASLWNTVRIFRIMIHQHIRDALLVGFAAKPPIFTQLRDTTQFQESTDICYQLQADILATVPQSLGFVRKTGSWHKPASELSLTIPSSSPDRSENTPSLSTASTDSSVSPPSLANKSFWEDLIEDDAPPSHIILNTPSGPSCNGFSLLWALWYAGHIDLSTPEIREYVAINLRRIGQDLGIQQALVLATGIEMNVEPKVWSEGA